jgi:hypothetical protein
VKFHHLHPGATFEYRGETFRKISPLKAERLDDGVQRLIPRSGEVVALGADGKPVEAPPRSLATEDVERVIVQMAERLRSSTENLEPPLLPAQRVALHQAIELARDDALNRLTGLRQ